MFGTDIDKDAVNAARTGLYPASISADVSAERLQRHFVKEDDGQYRIKKHIREMLVFAPQNVIKDPPFTKLDLLCLPQSADLPRPGAAAEAPAHVPLQPQTRGHSLPWVIGDHWAGHRPLFAHRQEMGRSVGARARRSPAPWSWISLAGRSQDDAHTRIPETVRRAEELSAVQLVETILQQTDAPPLRYH